MNKFKMITVGLLIAILPMAIYAAGPRNGMRSQPASFAAMDTNADNMVTAEEYDVFRQARMVERAQEGRLLRQAGNNNFADIDTNADGVLSQQEFANHQAQRMQNARNNQNRTF